MSLEQPRYLSCDIRGATHAKIHGTLHKIKSKWGVSPNGVLASPKEGGFGIYTENDHRFSMWEIDSYWKEKP